MAIGISGTNSNSSSVEVSVGPIPYVHRKGKSILGGVNLVDVLIGCFDPGNKKCYSGGGTSATDFISGNDYTITGDSNSDIAFLNNNAGTLQLTGGGHIKCNGSYSPSIGSLSGNLIEMWFWPATGPTQEEGLFEFRKNNNGTYENGYSIHRLATGSKRTLIMRGYGNDGTIYNTSPTTLTDAIFPDTWNHMIFQEFRNDPTGSRFRFFSILIRSQYHEYFQSAGNYQPGFSGLDPENYDDPAPKELRIGKVSGITGTFHGKIGLCKVVNGLYNLTPYPDSEIDPLEQNTTDSFASVIMYRSMAPRYDQYL